jgi:hypothetical protein
MRLSNDARSLANPPALHMLSLVVANHAISRTDQITSYRPTCGFTSEWKGIADGHPGLLPGPGPYSGVT